jgi:SagB-type dehydrogenase family enzyme
MVLALSRSSPKLKRSDTLVFYFQAGKLRCKNYLTGEEYETELALITILGALSRWRVRSEIERLFSRYSITSVRRTLRRLLCGKLLVVKGSEQDRQERALRAWNDWGIEAPAFHFTTKGTYRYEPHPADERQFIRNLTRHSPPPKPFKSYPGSPRTPLVDPLPYIRSEFPRVILSRRTHRQFGRGPIPLDQLSLLLRLTWSVTGYLDWPYLGKVPLKTSPSGGARQPLEVYVCVSHVSGLSRGIYHYRSDRHYLETVRGNIRSNDLADLCAGQHWVRDCGALFIMTAVLPRVMWRYRFSRAYRVLLMEAGHFCQTFCLVATWLGLAPFCTAALRDEKIEEKLRLDGVTETVLYAAGVGIRGQGGSS